VTATTVVVHEGGTPWWVPLAVALSVTALAAVASYYSAWRFKKSDTQRESALPAADLVDQAERLTVREGTAEVPSDDIRRLLQQARRRARSLGSAELDDRFKAALSFLFTFMEWQQIPPGGRRWLGEAVANVGEELDHYLVAPRFLPGRSALVLERSFPTLTELEAMPHDRGETLVAALEAWKGGSPLRKLEA
jgi:hypothetical protein